jgi:CheY-like chemotaxis protein
MEVGGGLQVQTANAVRGESDAAQRRPEEPGPGEYIVLSVTDTGTGMTEDVLSRALEPFFTTKEIGKGSGLGLAQVYGFAKQSGGGVRIETVPGRGTCVRVYLPRAPLQRPQAVESATIVMQQARCEIGDCTVLLVDDDAAVRAVTADMLHELGYTVMQAASGAAALEMLRREPGIDMLVADFAMPGMNGARLAESARALIPDLPVVFVTGYADTDEIEAAVGRDATILRKPFTLGELREALAQACAQTGELADS